MEAAKKLSFIALVAFGLLSRNDLVMKRFWLAALLLLSMACPTIAQNADPPGAMIDPPPAALDWAETLPKDQWTFGEYLWKGRDPCSAQSCQAAYNASPIYVMVWRDRNCCGQPGYSVEFDASTKGCFAKSYYLVFSKDIARFTVAERRDFVSRHVNSVAKGIASACKMADPEFISVAPLGDFLP